MRPLSSARPLSGVLEEATSGSGSWSSTRPPPSPLISDHHEPFAIPRTDAACDALLASAETRLNVQPASVREEVVVDLARFLGASSRVWTTQRRARLRTLLANAGHISVAPVLNAVAATPRDEVLDDAVAALTAASDEDDRVVGALVAIVRHPAMVASAGAAPREVALRTIARSNNAIAREVRLNVAYWLARTDPAPSVRDAAVQALSTMCLRDGRTIVLDLLGKLKATESSAQVRASIDDAIESARTL